MSLILIAIGGFLGAISRYVASNHVFHSQKGEFPIGTFVVNLVGSFLLGCLTKLSSNTDLLFFAGVGFLGSFTTFSTFKVEVLQLLQENKWKLPLTYMFLTYFGGIFLAYAGFILGKMIL